MTTNQVDKISDDFGSTFTLLNGDLYNMLWPREVDNVEAIIRKHIPEVKRIEFDAADEIAEGYFMYRIRVMYV